MARACPSPESEAALLRERLRAGTLSPERLELAAYAGSIGARCCLDACSCGCGWPRGTPTAAGPFLSDLHRDADHTDSRSLAVWVAGLSRWGPTVQVRAAVAAARAALPFWDAGRSEVREAAKEGLRRVKDWLDGHDGTTHRIRAAHDGGGPFAGVPHGIRSVLSSALRAETGDAGGLGIDLPAATHWAAMQFNQHRFAPEHGEPRVRAAIQSALISWSLGSKG